MSGEPFRKQVWVGDINVTPTPPGYCDFFDEFKCHAYMGGVPVRGEYRDDWTTCCGVDCPGADEAWEAAEAEVERLRGEVARQAEQITAVRALHARMRLEDYPTSPLTCAECHAYQPCPTLRALDSTP